MHVSVMQEVQDTELMSTKKTNTGNKEGPKNPATSSGGAQPVKRSKSTGFIESSDFKPNWLETGPLTPDMLPPDLPADDASLTPDEFDVLQDSLQRFYKESASEEPLEEETKAEPDEVVESPVVESETPPLPEVEAGYVEDSLLPVEETETATVEVEQPISPKDILTDEETDPIAGIETESVTFTKNEPSPTVEPIESEAEPFATLEEELYAENEPPLTVEPNEPEAEPFAALEEELNAEIEALDSTPPPDDWIASLTEVVEARPQPLAASYLVEAPTFDPAEEEADIFLDDEPEPTYEPVFTAPPAPIPAAVKPPRKSKPKKRRDRLSGILLLSSLLLLGAAALVYFVNPFSRIALGASSLARPVSSPAVAAPETGSGDWCLSGEFLADADSQPRLIDSGAGGDILAEDQVFSLEYILPSPGTYEWQVMDCNNEALAYPESPAWVTTTEPNQSVTFNFDSNERSDPLFFPIPYVVSALDDVNEFQVVGDFQDWNPDDASGQLQRINIGLYQQVRRIARAGTYEAYVIGDDERQAIDAYGRTTSPIPFSFQTDRNGDYVVFLVDTDRGRASIMYDMPPFLTSLAYGNGNWMLSVTLLTLAALLLLGTVLRLIILNNKKLQMESGCPNCGRQELMRISRRGSDRLLHVFGIPAYRYRCRNCTWEGSRLSDKGVAVSPGVELANINDR